MSTRKKTATFFNDYPSPCVGGMPPCGSDGSLPSWPQWMALFDLFDIVLSVFVCMCIFSLFYYYFFIKKKEKRCDSEIAFPLDAGCKRQGIKSKFELKGLT